MVLLWRTRDRAFEIANPDLGGVEVLSVGLEKSRWPSFPPGLVWLIGAGPGDPGLLTLHGLNALQQADVIVYDALVNPEILSWKRAGAEAVYSGKRGGRPSPSQRDISLKLIDMSRSGKRVARLKGGDPFVFGRGGEEALALVRAGVQIRITPGITAGIGGLAYAGIPATHRDTNQSITFLTGHDKFGSAPTEVDWGAIAKGSGALVIYMAVKHLAKIALCLIDNGRSEHEPVAIISDATLPSQRALVTTLGKANADMERHKISAPAIVCIGRNVLHHKALSWAERFWGENSQTPDTSWKPVPPES